MTNFIDLSHPLEPGMPEYPGLPSPHFEVFFSHAESAERGLYTPGTTFQIARYEMGGNTGTYVDAPFHRHPDGPDLGQLGLDKLANLPGLVVTAASDGAISPATFDRLELKGKALMIKTNWSSRWGGPDYFRSGPFLNKAACQRLVESGVALVGIDCANIDDMSDKNRPAHISLLAAHIPIVEHLCNLENLPTTNFRFFAVPPAIKGGTSFPVRAFAIIS